MPLTYDSSLFCQRSNKLRPRPAHPARLPLATARVVGPTDCVWSRIWGLGQRNYCQLSVCVIDYKGTNRGVAKSGPLSRTLYCICKSPIGTFGHVPKTGLMINLDLNRSKEKRKKKKKNNLGAPVQKNAGWVTCGCSTGPVARTASFSGPGPILRFSLLISEGGVISIDASSAVRLRVQVQHFMISLGALPVCHAGAATVAHA